MLQFLNSLLTPAEIKLAVLIKLGLSNKEMATLLYQTHDSLKVSRSRLRKKMNLENDTNLFSFLATY
ncbi:MAG: hypothetical protein FJY10_00400 [Bacteroidetes bacterium]|nr:hypothetical protein [Bacteroidota bacterium]